MPPFMIGRLKFQSTLPTRGSDRHARAIITLCDSFNPRSPRGGATTFYCASALTAVCFNPRSPRGGATSRPPLKVLSITRFNPRSPRGGATTYRRNGGGGQTGFNPRSPRGGATIYTVPETADIYVSIHAPHEGERPLGDISALDVYMFQSTLPTRGSDFVRALDSQRGVGFQSTLPTRGSDANKIAVELFPYKVSIHAPHEGERRGLATLLRILKCFNPRSPRGGATVNDIRNGKIYNVSIHAPHEGERLQFDVTAPLYWWFQSTLPTRGSDHHLHQP